MGKHISQVNDLSGNDIALISVAPEFIYELSLHKYWENGYCILGSKLYKSSKLLNIEKNFIIKKYKDYTIIKEINLVGAPQSFVDQLEVRNSKKKLKKKK